MNPTGTTRAPAPPFGRHPRTTVAVAATLVLLLELGATLATLGGDPFAPVAGWGATRPADALTFALVAVGCGALYWCVTRPLTALFTATAAYSAFMLLGHELGLFLAPMAALYAVAVLGSSGAGALPTRRPPAPSADAPSRAALLAPAAAYAASLFWVHERTSTVTDPGAALLAWVAFGTVIGVFLAGPYVAGELVRLRRSLAARPEPTPAQHTPTA